MMRAWKVRVRVVDEAANRLVDTTVKCAALDPGAACAPAYVLARQDFKAAYPKLPRAHAVSFLVMADKDGKQPAAGGRMEL